MALSLQTKEHSYIFVAGWIKSLSKTVLHLELACSYKLTGAKEIKVQSLEDLGDRKFMNTQVLNIWRWFRVTKPKNKKKSQATSSAPPPKEVLLRQAAPQKPGKVLAPRLTSAKAALQKARVQQQSDARVAAAAAAAAEAEQKEREKQREQRKREQEEARVKQLQEAKRLKAQAV